MKKLINFLTIGALMLGMLPSLNAAASGGTGTANDPYLISSADDWSEFRTYVNSDADGGAGEYWRLTADIDFADPEGNRGWIDPVALYDTSDKMGTMFKGNLDGGGHVIKNYLINAVKLNTTVGRHGAFGLFSAIGGDAVIENLGVENVTFRLKQDNWIYISAGAIAGFMTDNAVISNCYSKNVTCDYNTEWTGNGAQFSCCGGIAGAMRENSKIEKCYSRQFSKGNGFGSYFSGIVGGIYSANTSIQKCYSDTTIGVADAGAWGSGWWEMYYPDTTTLPWPYAYYSQGTPVGYIGETQTAEELKDVPDNLKGVFEADSNNINGGYPIFPWQQPGKEVLIGTAEELIAAANEINNDPDGGEGNVYKLTADIDLENAVWSTYIGTYNYDDEKEDFKPFKGTFDGNGHIIKNYTLKGAHKIMTGLFGAIGGNAVIKNMGVRNVSVIVDTDWVWTVAGGLAGCVSENAEVTDCYAKNVTMDITNYKIYGDARNSISEGGGLVGEIRGSGAVRNCYARGITMDTEEVNFDGGIAGYVMGNGTIENCYSDLYIAASPKNEAEVSDCYYSKNPPWPWNTGADKNYIYRGTMVAGDEELKTLAPTLGDSFSIDSITSMINDGYPVLKWEYDAPALAGAGTADMPYEIHTIDDFAIFATYDETAGKYFKLMDDVDFNGISWNTPLGTEAAPFEGIFDGGGHVVENIVLKAPQKGKTEYIGLFGYIGADAQICDLGIENVTAEPAGEWGYNTVCGALAGGSAGNASISRCYVKNMTFDNKGQYNFVFLSGGGLLGQVEGEGVKITDCYSIGTKANNNCVAHESGLAGRLLDFESVANCYSDTTLSMCPDGDMSKVSNSYYLTETAGTLYKRAGTLVTGEELRNMGDKLGGSFMNNADGYPMLDWEESAEMDEITSVTYINEAGEETQSASGAVSMKSAGVAKNNGKAGRLFAASYKNGVLTDVVICADEVTASGEYNIGLSLANADTVKIFIMTDNMVPLIKAYTESVQ